MFIGSSANYSLMSKSRHEIRAEVFKALAHPSRVLIAETLSDGERCVRDLTSLIGADVSTVSKHLRLMKEAGVLSVEKRGQNQFYRLACPCFLEFFRCADLIVREKSHCLAA